jgi:putative flippase GtrA
VATRDAPRRPALVRELGAFGIVGLVAYVVDVGLFNLLRFAGDPGLLEQRPLTAKVISVAVATAVSYAGNRHWTWRHRSRRRLHREITLFLVFNAIGLAIALICLALSHYALGLTSPLADNISANGVGLVLATAFRFWAYRTHVFPVGPPGDGLTPPPTDAGPRSAPHPRSHASAAPAGRATRTPRRGGRRRSTRRR